MIIINESHYKVKIDFSYFNGIYYLARIILKGFSKIYPKGPSRMRGFWRNKNQDGRQKIIYRDFIFRRRIYKKYSSIVRSKFDKKSLRTSKMRSLIQCALFFTRLRQKWIFDNLRKYKILIKTHVYWWSLWDRYTDENGPF